MNREFMDVLRSEYDDGCCGAKVIQVIQSRLKKGHGTDDDPNRIVTLYRSLDGELLAVYDPLVKQ